MKSNVAFPTSGVISARLYTYILSSPCVGCDKYLHIARVLFLIRINTFTSSGLRGILTFSVGTQGYKADWRLDAVQLQYGSKDNKRENRKKINIRIFS